MRLALVALLAVSVSGCSVALQERPRAATASAPARCDDTKLWWMIDAAAVAAGVAAVAYGIAQGDDTGMIAGGAGGMGAVLYGASMSSGISWSRCRQPTEHPTGPLPALASR